MSALDTALLYVDDDELAERAKTELAAMRKALQDAGIDLPTDEDLGRRCIISGGEVLEL